MKITLLYLVSCFIRVKKQRNIQNWDQQNYLVLTGFCYIRPLYNEVSLYTCTYKNLLHKGNSVQWNLVYNEVLGTMKITLLYQISHNIRVKNLRNTKSWDQQNYLVIRGFCYIPPLYNEVPLYNKVLGTMKFFCCIRYFVISVFDKQ